MITDAQYAAWLEDSSAQRVTLFEVGVNSGGEEITRYLSTKPYSFGSVATPYLAVVAGGLRVRRSISLIAAATLSVGDVEINNPDGRLDSWLRDIWVNKPIQVWVGDVRWDRADFRQVLSGIVADIDGTKSRDRLNLRIRDKLQRLNTPVSEDVMGVNSPTPATLRPIALGELHNITPKLKNDVTREYEFNSTASEDVIEVRTDAKVRTDVTKNLAVGSFTFTSAVGPGVVTCSVQGVKPSGTYSNTIAKLVQYLVTQCGKASDRFTVGDLDVANLAAFDAAHPQATGLYIPERMNVLEACARLAGSVGAQLVMSSIGLLQLVQISFPTSAVTELRAGTRADSSIQLVAETEVDASIKVGYCKNWTLQANLQTSIPTAHKELFATEWLPAVATDGAVKAAYKLDAAPVLQETCLQVAADADAEVLRRLGIFKVKRRTYRFEGTPGNMLLELGQAVKLFANRYELSDGEFGVVTALELDFASFHVMVEVTI